MKRCDQIAVSDAALMELIRACERFGPMASPHEGWAVIREELDELWEHVRGDTGRSAEARVEAIQIAAVAMRYALDLCSTLQPALAPGPFDHLNDDDLAAVHHALRMEADRDAVSLPLADAAWLQIVIRSERRAREPEATSPRKEKRQSVA